MNQMFHTRMNQQNHTRIEQKRLKIAWFYKLLVRNSSNQSIMSPKQVFFKSRSYARGLKTQSVITTLIHFPIRTQHKTMKFIRPQD